MKWRGATRAYGIAAAAVLVTTCALEETEQPMTETPARPARAVARLRPVDQSGVEGTVTFVPARAGIRVTGEVRNLSPGEHGFHVHEFGDCSGEGARSAGGHFNPYDMPHGSPDSVQRHVGDLGNITADSAGTATIDRVDPMIRFEGPASIIGRAVVVHTQADDFTTQPTGAAGGRVACGVIGVAANQQEGEGGDTGE
jgi:Cu-Zn family superoxide dismutase